MTTTTPPRTIAPGRSLRGTLRALIFGNLMRTLAMLLGLVQVGIGHWLWVVAAGRPGPGWAIGGLAAAALIVANVAVMPVLRRARRGEGWARRLAVLYMSTGLASLLVGIAVGLSWLGLFPLSALLAAAGFDAEFAYQGFRAASLALVGSLTAMIFWGFTGGQARVDRTQVPVVLDGLHPSHDGLRIVQISDLHIGNGLEGEILAGMVESVNALDPDVVVLTGDIFDFDPRYVEAGAQGLAALRARLGVFAVLGNHDVYTGVDTVVSGLADHAPHIRLLRGEHVRLPGDAPLYLAGVDDPGLSQNWTDRDVHLEDLERLGESLPADGPVVLLVHRPEAFPQAARLGFPLMLSGHTHGGQIAFPMPGGRFNVARIMTPFSRGLYRMRSSVLYVNRGIGVAGPALRFNCNREITTFELRAR